MSTSTKWIIGIFVFLAVLFLAGGLFVRSQLSRIPEVRSNSVLAVSLSGRVEEEEPLGVAGQLIGGRRLTLKRILDALEKAAADRRVTAALVRIGSLDAGWAKVDELRRALSEFGEKKPLAVYLDYCGDKEYYLATAAPRIYMLPSGELELDGLAAHVMFLRGTLDKLGIEPEMEHIGKYKSASETLTRKSLSKAHREVVNSILDERYESLVRGIAEARGIEPSKVRKLIDEGPFRASRAVELGLVDSLAYEPDLKNLLSGTEHPNEISLAAYASAYSYFPRISKGKRMALINATGTIVGGRSRRDPFLGRLMGARTIVEALDEARRNKSVKAVILRIDSGGGSGLASDEIWNAVLETKKEKPVVVSMSDLAASGGYYIAMAADSIVAQPGTLTGSIGVIGGKFKLTGLYRKLGIEVETVSRGKNSLMSSPFASLTREQRRKLKAELEDFYNDFVGKVAEARGKSFQETDAIARGRVWSGRQALRNGLVDRLGGLETAVEIAKRIAGIPEEQSITLVTYPRRTRTLIQKLLSQLLGVGIIREPALGDARQLRYLKAALSSLQGVPLALTPYWVEIE